MLRNAKQCILERTTLTMKIVRMVLFWKVLKLNLGVIISHGLKTFSQCVRAYANANKILGMINRMIVNKHSDIMI